MHGRHALRERPAAAPVLDSNASASGGASGLRSQCIFTRAQARAGQAWAALYSACAARSWGSPCSFCCTLDMSRYWTPLLTTRSRSRHCSGRSSTAPHRCYVTLLMQSTSSAQFSCRLAGPSGLAVRMTAPAFKTVKLNHAGIMRILAGHWRACQDPE